MHVSGALDGDEWGVGGRIKQFGGCGKWLRLRAENDACYRSPAVRMIGFLPWLARVILELVRSSLLSSPYQFVMPPRVLASGAFSSREYLH